MSAGQPAAASPDAAANASGVTPGAPLNCAPVQAQLRQATSVQLVAFQPTAAGTGAQGAVTILPNRDVLLLDVRGLPALPPNKVYEERHRRSSAARRLIGASGGAP